MFQSDRKPPSENAAAHKLPARGQRGALLIFIFLGLAVLAGIYASIYYMKNQRSEARRGNMRRQDVGESCERAMKIVIRELMLEKKNTGQYPYEFSEEFLERHRAAEPYIFNRRLWTPASGGALKLETAYGDSFTLTGFCRNGHIYEYDSLNNTGSRR